MRTTKYVEHTTVSCLQVQADLNGDGTDEVLVSSHGTTIQARLLYCMTAVLSATDSAVPKAIHFPAVSHSWDMLQKEQTV